MRAKELYESLLKLLVCNLVNDQHRVILARTPGQLLLTDIVLQVDGHVLVLTGLNDL